MAGTGHRIPGRRYSVIRCAGRSMSRSNSERKSRPSRPAMADRQPRSSATGRPSRWYRRSAFRGAVAGVAEPQRAGQGVRALLMPPMPRIADATHPSRSRPRRRTSVLAHQCAFCAGVEDERRRGFVDLHRHQEVAVDDVHRHHAALFHPALGVRRRGEGDAQEQRKNWSHGGRRSIQPPCATRQPLFLGVSVGRHARLRLRRTGGAASAMVPSGALKIAAPLRAADQHRRRGGGATRPERAGRAAHHAERRVSVVAALLRTRDLAPLPRRAVATVVQAGLMPVTAGSSWPPLPC